MTYRKGSFPPLTPHLSWTFSSGKREGEGRRETEEEEGGRRKEVGFKQTRLCPPNRDYIWDYTRDAYVIERVDLSLIQSSLKNRSPKVAFQAEWYRVIKQMLVSDERYHGYDIFFEAPACRDNTRLRADISLRNGTSVVVEFKVLADTSKRRLTKLQTMPRFLEPISASSSISRIETLSSGLRN
jgi:hypothetical protein